MKRLFLTALAGFMFLIQAHAQTFQDTTFTDPVVISFPLDFVTFKNCHFIGIQGDALTLEGAGALVSNCTFENISGTAISCLLSEVYVVEDTLFNIGSNGVMAEGGVMVVLRSQITQIQQSAVVCNACDVAEVTDCKIQKAASGILFSGPQDVVGEYVIRTTIISQISGPVAPHAIVVDYGADLSIEGCTIDSCQGIGILIDHIGSVTGSQEPLSLLRNKISHTGLSGIIGKEAAFKGVIRDNELSYTGLGPATEDWGDPAIFWSGLDAVIEQNRIHDIISDNCQDNYCGTAILITVPVTLTRNHIYNCSGSGIRFHDLTQFQSITPLLIFNNIIHDIKGHPLQYLRTFPAFINNEPISTIIRNNTVHSLDNPVIFIAGNLNPISVDGNILLWEGNPDTSKFIEFSAVGPFSELLNLKASGDIGFVDFAGRDFHLAGDNSLAHNILPINFGLPNDDFDGDLRLGLRDAGADEIALPDVICGCNNCPNEIPQLFFTDFTFAVLAADQNNLAQSGQGVCGVRVAFNHEYVGDLSMALISPAGQSVGLIGPSGFWGSTSSTNWNIGFVPCSIDASPDPGFSDIWNSNQSWGESANYTGSYYPATGCLENFNTGTVTGEWKLRVYDTQAEDTGSVLGFEVTFCNADGVSCFVCSEPPVAQFEANAASSWGIFFNNLTTGNVNQYVVDYGDGESESGPNLPQFHLYENAGSYLVRLIATNDCGSDTVTQVVQIAGSLPVAFAAAEPFEGCTPLEVQTVIINADHVDNWHWFFPGGSPAESLEMAPKVVYNTPGTYSVTLILENEVGTSIIQNIFSVEVKQGVVNPSFDLQVVGDSIICTNTSSQFTGFYWTINGGAPVGQNTSPFIYEANASAVYEVRFFVSDSCQTYTFFELATVIHVSNQDLEKEGWTLEVSPNPNDGNFQLNILALENLPARVSIQSSLGTEVLVQKIVLEKGNNRQGFNLNNLPAGVYLLHIQTLKGQFQRRLVIGD